MLNLPPLDQLDQDNSDGSGNYLGELLQTIWRREFKDPLSGEKSKLEKLNERLLDTITCSKDNSVAGLPDGR